MAGIFTTFNTARSGLFAQQAAVDTTSHNVSNATTEGYTRQRVQMSATPAFNSTVGQVGTGVEITLITRIRDGYLDSQIREEMGIQGEYGVRQEVLEQVEMIFNEPSDTGLSSTMEEMWDAWQELSKSPENSNARTLVAESAQSFTDQLNHMADQLIILKEDTLNLMGKNIYDGQSILKQVNSLNEQISRITARGDAPNDLLDQRDLLLDQLSSVTDFEKVDETDGTVTITIGGKKMTNLTASDEVYEMSLVRNVQQTSTGDYEITLVRNGDSLDGVQTFTISKDDYEASYEDLLITGETILNKQNMSNTDTTITALSSGDITAFSPQKGELAGYYTVQKELDSYSNGLDNLAYAMATTVNTIQQGGDSTQENFFVGDGTKITAKNISVNNNILEDVSKINAGEVIDGTGADGDGSRALAIAQLKNGRFTINSLGALSHDTTAMGIDNQTGGTTFDNYYNDIVAKLGISAQQASGMLENQEALLGQLQQRKESISGVSIDEEVANLVMYQKAYQANAQVIQTLTTMLDTIINKMGV